MIVFSIVIFISWDHWHMYILICTNKNANIPQSKISMHSLDTNEQVSKITILFVDLNMNTYSTSDKYAHVLRFIVFAVIWYCSMSPGPRFNIRLICLRRLIVWPREDSEAMRLVFWIVASLWNLTDTSAALLPMCLSNWKSNLASYRMTSLKSESSCHWYKYG